MAFWYCWHHCQYGLLRVWVGFVYYIARSLSLHVFYFSQSTLLSCDIIQQCSLSITSIKFLYLQYARFLSPFSVVWFFFYSFCRVVVLLLLSSFFACDRFAVLKSSSSLILCCRVSYGDILYVVLCSNMCALI